MMTHHYPYLIVGGGMTADAAVRGIRQVDANGAIGLIGSESDPPYNRPPLSKGLWKRMPLARIWRNTASLGVDLHLGRTVVHLDAAARYVVDDHGTQYNFDSLLLATGGEPIRLAADSERLITYRTLADYHRLRALMETSQRFAVIGGGFIGSEMAAVLAAHGKDVTMIFPEDGICARVLPADISQHLNTTFRERGVRVMTGTWVRSAASAPDTVTVHTDQEVLVFDGVVAGLGIRPNTQLAQIAGLHTGSGRLAGHGIEVDEFLRTSQPNIFAAGDVALFYNPILAQFMRVEHEEHANLTGQYAGMGMAGQLTRYDHLPSVYSTLFDISYDAVGELDPRMEIVYDWQEPFQKGTIYYLAEKRVRGVLLWNISRGLDQARAWISNPGPIQPADLQK
jgi:NADPH-dependent 2,4-dienoyl-CoA reductase/sulfur reductase-like enzyme